MTSFVARPGYVMRGIMSRVSEERRRRGWSAEMLSERLESLGYKIPRSVIANLENNRRNAITIDEVLGLAHVFSTTVNWLVYGTGRACTVCNDEPPAGFTCNDCQRSRSIRIEDVLDQRAFFEGYVTR